MLKKPQKKPKHQKNFTNQENPQIREEGELQQSGMGKAPNNVDLLKRIHDGINTEVQRNVPST